MRILRLCWILLILALAFCSSLVTWVLPKDSFYALTRFWHRQIYRAVGVVVRYHESEDLQPGSLIVANHISWLDIHLIGARWPVVFLSKSSVRRWPVIGWLAARVGTLFIRRGSGAAGATREIAQALGEGQVVTIFPEARTSEGLDVLRFHARLFQAALDGGNPIRPLALRYHTAAGAPDSRVSFAGDVALLQSLWRTLGGTRPCAEVTLFDSLPAGLDRQRAATAAEAQIRAVVAAD